MKNLILFDDDGWKSLLPLSYTRPLSECRIGIFTITEKWKRLLNAEASFITQDYLSDKYSIKIAEYNLVINGRLLPNDKILSLIAQLKNNDALLFNDQLVAARLNSGQFNKLIEGENFEELSGVELSKETGLIELINGTQDIFLQCGKQIVNDLKLIKKTASFNEVPESFFCEHPENVFIENGAKVSACFLDASSGPIYVAKGAEIMQGSMIKGPVAICQGAVVKMGAKIYGPTTIGPYSKVGGEVNNSVFFAHSNKAHDGFLGNSVIGEWCNIGADSNNSNLKNNYAEVKLWDYNTERFKTTGLQFCGLIMGDHSKLGINTMINTGTVIGVSCNIYGDGFPRNFIPSFSWGGTHGFSTFKVEKAFGVAERVMKRRAKDFDEHEQKILEHVFHASSHYRTWEA